MGGRGSSSSGGSIRTSNKIKKEFIDRGLKSKFAGTRKRAENGTGAFSFKDATALSKKNATKMHIAGVEEHNGKTLVHGILGEKKVFYANKSSDGTVKKLLQKRNTQKQQSVSRGNTEIRTTSTYDRWKKNHDKNFANWFYGNK